MKLKSTFSLSLLVIVLAACSTAVFEIYNPLILPQGSALSILFQDPTSNKVAVYWGQCLGIAIALGFLFDVVLANSESRQGREHVYAPVAISGKFIIIGDWQLESDRQFSTHYCKIDKYSDVITIYTEGSVRKVRDLLNDYDKKVVYAYQDRQVTITNDYQYNVLSVTESRRLLTSFPD